MNKGRKDVDNSALSKPTWEIMKIISEITKFCREIIFGAIFKARTPRKKCRGHECLPPLKRELLHSFVMNIPPNLKSKQV